jgi:hypothetical protein
MLPDHDDECGPDMQTDKLAENRRVSFHGLRKTEYIINIKFGWHCCHVHIITIYT